MRAEILRQVRATERPVVLFDVDSTLLCTGGRHLAILRAYTEQAGDPELAGVVARLGPDAFEWNVDEPLRGTALEHHTSALIDFWWGAFFSDRYLEDEPMPGAVSFVSKLHRDGAWIYYLTARDVRGMGAGTAKQLLERGFPLLTSRVCLHLKPEPTMSDADFKALALEEVGRLGTVVATYENEPKNANLFARTFPDARHFLVGDRCSPDPPPLDGGIQRIEDFTS